MEPKKITITNEEVYNRIVSGQTQKSLAEEFGVSHMRIHQIYQKQQQLIELMKDDLYALCVHFSYGDQALATRVYRGLHRGNIYAVGYYIAPVTTLDELKLLSLEGIARVINMGPKSVDVIRRMKLYLEAIEEDYLDD